MLHRRLGVGPGLLAAALFLPFVANACSQSFVAVRDEAHPAGGHYLVTATIEEWPNGYYSTAITIRNVSTKPLVLKPTMFRLEGTAPTAFVPADRIPMLMGRAGYRMPERIEPRSSGQGEVFFGIRGTEVPNGPIRLVVELPDGAHVFDFELVS
jgi:hypothetical protein